MGPPSARDSRSQTQAPPSPSSEGCANGCGERREEEATPVTSLHLCQSREALRAGAPPNAPNPIRDRWPQIVGPLDHRIPLPDG